VHYEEINGTQTTFLIGRDMSYFSKNVVYLLSLFHPVEPSQRAIGIDAFRPQAQIQMSNSKYLDLEEETNRRKEALQFFRKNLLLSFL